VTDAAAAGGKPLAESTVAIVGVGLLGGSVGMALAGQCAWRIGVVGDADDTVAPVTSGCVDVVAPLEVAVGAADLVVLAAPVRAIVELVAQVGAAARPGTVVTDVGSTKRAIVAAMDELPEGVAAVGGHPMAGGELPGLEHADGELFEGRSWALVPTARTTPAADRLVRELVAAVGGEVVDVPADDHDRIVALTSHVPYVLGQALLAAQAQLAAELPQAELLTGGGFRDVTRLARGDQRMWADILATNGDQVDVAMAMLGRAID
jgi:prephenate dehydrogenase